MLVSSLLAAIVICLSPRLSHTQRNTLQCTGSFSSLGRCGTAAACCCCPLLPAVPSPHWAIIYNSVTLSVFSANLTQVCPACSEMLVSKIKPRTDALQMQWFILRPWLLWLPAAARNAWNLRFWWISGDARRDMELAILMDYWGPAWTCGTRDSSKR